MERQPRKSLLAPGIVIFTLVTLSIPFGVADQRARIATMEIVGLILLPLFVFYARCNWSPRMLALNIPVIVLLWSFSYGILHEVSHLLGVVVVGDTIVDYHLFPKFWEGDFDFSKGWVRSQTLHDWRDALPGLFPYLRDILFLVGGLAILNTKKIRNSFLAGLVFTFLCLSPVFDLADNYVVGYVMKSATGNDFVGTAMKIGHIWTNVVGTAFLAFAVCTTLWILRLYKNFPGSVPHSALLADVADHHTHSG